MKTASLPLLGALCLILAACGGGSSTADRSVTNSSASTSEHGVSESSISVASEASISSAEASSSEATALSSTSGQSSTTDESSAVNTSSSSTGVTEGWALVWSDEFEGNSIDSNKWEHEVNCWGGGNEEDQCYTSNQANSYVQDGLLHITALREHSCGPAHNQEDPAYNPNDTSTCKNHTSARLRTKGLGDWTYGRIEVRARMPSGEGMWPAIWMLPTDTVYGGWPHSGEIDIFEAFSPGTNTFEPINRIHGTLHYGFSWPWNQYSGRDYTPTANIWDTFHTYAVEWEQGEIRWYVNDVHFATNSGNWFSYFWGGQEVGYQVSKDGQPFDQDFHLILNLAVGSPWLGYPDESVAWPQKMEVEFVRVYQCATNPETGIGCATGNPNLPSMPGHLPPPDTRDEVLLYRDGAASTLTFNVNNNTLEHTLTPAFWEAADGNVIANPAYGTDDGLVWDIRFTGPGNAFLTTDDMAHAPGILPGLNFGDNLNGRAKNLGEFRFDLRVLEIEPGTALRIKLDSGWPNLSFHEIEIPPTGEWTEIAVRFYSLRPNDGESWNPSVNYTHIANAFVIEPVGGTAHVQLNNIRIQCLEDCEIRLR